MTNNIIRMLSSGTVTEPLLQFLANPAVIITLATLMFTIFARAIVGIFKLGIYFSEKELSQKQIKFEKQMIDDMRSYKEELLRVVLAAAMSSINDKLKDVDTIAKTATGIKTTEAKLEIQIKNAMEKVDEVRSMADTVRSLSARIDRLQYGQENQDQRRKE